MSIGNVGQHLCSDLSDTYISVLHKIQLCLSFIPHR